MKLLFVWILNALALLAVAYFVPDIHVADFLTALVAALVIGLVNMLIKPILVILTLPITILTLGLFILVINGLLFYAVGNWLQGFEVKTITTGIIGALVYSVLSWLLSALLIEDK
ncbi:MAG: phage holin family protein [Methylotenera sp.]|uniref:phage holin family protein n=1 Tax=Methylotenera sp. TaxID=2051956 RepID=UPI0018538D70|nr:phage holin family protein [Methylotenera sp.]NOU25773.1 phage holin family protein [Methylotenera sp.]